MADRIETYHKALLQKGTADQELLDALDARRPTKPDGSGFQGADRVVAWDVEDGEDEGRPGATVFYLSKGAVRAAEEAGIKLDLRGEVAASDLPANRKLFIGLPAVDWQG